VIDRLLPPGVRVAELRDFDAAGDLWPEEAAGLGEVCCGRAAEFRAGRHCARAALARLGVTAGAVPRGGDRAPRWPAGAVGAITHTQGYAAAAVGLEIAYASIGIDAEPNLPLPPVVAGKVLQPAERRWLARVGTGDGVCWDRLLFSAKESVYKVWAPLTGGAWLGFLDATATVLPDEGRFHAVLHVPPPLVDGVPVAGFTGRFLALGGLLLTAITLCRTGDDP
jgi:4'-phosphopantetheinyl transferase EntD